MIWFTHGAAFVVGVAMGAMGGAALMFWLVALGFARSLREAEAAHGQTAPEPPAPQTVTAPPKVATWIDLRGSHRGH